jgi:hypothetical protein
VYDFNYRINLHVFNCELMIENYENALVREMLNDGDQLLRVQTHDLRTS